MDTFVTIEVVHDANDEDCSPAIQRAFDRFAEVEACCSRFDECSELNLISAVVGVPLRPSAIVFRAIDCAMTIAEATEGAFDLAIGGAMEARGFNREYRSGRVALSSGRTTGSYRDVIVDRVAETVTLLQPLRLDLGAVAKGLAIDLASAELRNFRGAIVDAGGDIFAQGCDRTLQPWSVAIRDPREQEQAVARTIALSDAAVCTSGDYERRDPTGAGHHILNPATGHSVDAMSSVSIVAGSAMVADALATAAFVIGSARAPALLARFGAEGLFLHGDGRCVGTGGFAPRSVGGGSGQRG